MNNFDLLPVQLQMRIEQLVILCKKLRDEYRLEDDPVKKRIITDRLLELEDERKELVGF